jgi:hypothetical protein
MKINYKGFKSLPAICEYFDWDYNLVTQKLAIGLSFEGIAKEIKQENVRRKRQIYFNEYYKKVLKQKRLQNKNNKLD